MSLVVLWIANYLIKRLENPMFDGKLDCLYLICNNNCFCLFVSNGPLHRTRETKTSSFALIFIYLFIF